MKLLSTMAGAAALLLAMMTQIASAGEATVVDGGARLRTGPGANYGIIRGLPSGTVVNVRNCYGRWCRVRVHGLRGWIVMSRLALPYVGRPGDETPVGGGAIGSDGNPTGVGADGEPNNGYVKILGIVVDRPGYCYALSHSGQSIIVKCL